MMTDNLGRLQRVPLREVWLNESTHFTPWLARPENLQLLGETLKLELESVAEQVAAGTLTETKQLQLEYWTELAKLALLPGRRSRDTCEGDHRTG
jgi:hypothetical protein